MKKVLLTGAFAIIAAIAGAWVGKSSAPTQTVNIINNQGENISVAPKVAATKYESLYKNYLRLSLENEALSLELAQLKKENQRLSTKPNSPASIDSITDDNSLLTVVSGDYIFTLKACQLRGTQIDCTLTVMSEMDSANFKLHGISTQGGPSKIIDAEGNEYLPSKIALGSASHNQWVTNSLTKNIPVKIEMTFQDIPENLQQLTALKVASSAGSTIFKDITLQ